MCFLVVGSIYSVSGVMNRRITKPYSGVSLRIVFVNPFTPAGQLTEGFVLAACFCFTC